MSKLWDTTLAYDEYLQLNKLMVALFGEDYHKRANALPDAARKGATLSSTSSFACSSVSCKADMRPDAEHIVGLMKAFFDDKTQTLCVVM